MDTVVTPAPTRRWVCSCPVHVLFAMYTDLGGVHVKLSGRLGYQLNYVYDLTGHAPLLMHCPACHTWQSLSYDHTEQRVVTGKWLGIKPNVDCAACAKKEQKHHGE